MARVTIVGPRTTPPELQRWLDAVVAAAERGTPGDWPHPHPDLPDRQVTLQQVLDVVGRTFTVDGEAWSIARHGLPPLPGAAGGPASGTDPDPDPNSGSKFHNMMHGLLGDFH